MAPQGMAALWNVWELTEADSVTWPKNNAQLTQWAMGAEVQVLATAELMRQVSVNRLALGAG